MKTFIRFEGTIRRGAALLVLLCSTHAHAFQDEGTVNIGLIESSTGSFAGAGLAGLWGSQIAIDEINAAGGITIAGKKVKISASANGAGYDAGPDAGVTLPLVKRAIFDDKVLMIKGITVSNTAQAVFSYLNELDQQGNAVAVHSSIIGAPGLPKISKWAFRNVFNESGVMPRVTAAVQKETNAKTAAFFVQKDNIYFPSIGENAIKPALKSLGVEIKATAEAVGTDRDVSRQVDELRAAQADLVYVLANGLPSIIFLKEARRRNLAPKRFVGTAGQLLNDVLKAGPEVTDGMIVAGPYNPQSPLLAKLGEEFKKRYSQELTVYAVNSYEAIYLIKDGIEKSGIKNTPETLTQDRKAFRDAFAQQASITSVTGERLKFDEDRETPKEGVLLIFEGGQPVPWSPK